MTTPPPPITIGIAAATAAVCHAVPHLKRHWLAWVDHLDQQAEAERREDDHTQDQQDPNTRKDH